MPDAIITSTESTFGTISGTFAADQSTVTGTVAGIITGTLTGSVGVPGPQGPAGPQGPQGEPGAPGEGVPAGGLAGQFLQKTTTGVDYATDWVTVNLGNYLVKSNNLSDLTSTSDARDNLQLGTLNTPTFVGVTAQGSGANVAQLSSTALTLNHTGYGQFTIQPSSGITFPDTSVQTTAFPAGSDMPTGGSTGQVLTKQSNGNYDADWQTISLTGFATESWVTANFYPLTGNPSGFITASALSPYLTIATASATYQTLSGMADYLSKAGNLAGLANAGTARSNLGLGIANTVQFAQVNVLGGEYASYVTTFGFTNSRTYSGPSGMIVNYGILTSDDGINLVKEIGNPAQATATVKAGDGMVVNDGDGSQMTFGSTGITFPDATNQTTAFPGFAGYATESWVTSQGYLTDAPSDGNQYARKNGAWDIVSGGASYITSVSSPLAVSSGNLTVDLSTYAPLASPAFTGNPTAPTAALADNDTSIATTAFVQQELLSGTANARNLEVYVRNQTGSTIPAGSIVYINGATGNRPTITLAQANNDANSAQTFGFTKAAIANNGFGFVIVRGELENIDTQSLTEGVQLYLSPTTAGTWTTTKPSAPQHLVYVGIVVRAHPTQGVILVAVQNGYELEELHDVSIGTLADNDLLAYESSTDLWKNKTATALGLAGLNSPTFTGTPSLPTGTTAVTQTLGDNSTKVATTAFVIANAGGGGGGGGTDVQVFGDATTSGTFTWTKPAGAKWVEILLFGGGGGGGSGSRQATTSARSGGGGGSGAATLVARMDASALGGSETVVVGGGGGGGAARTTDSTNGANGSNGGNSTFSIFKAAGGGLGNGGSTIAGIAAASRPSWFQAVNGIGSGAAGAGSIGVGSAATTITQALSFVATGGGGGGGSGANAVSPTSGGVGGTKQAASSTQSGIGFYSGGSGGTVGGTPPTNGVDGNTLSGGGTGGGGGAYRTAIAGMSGANGGWPGGGGGGGGASDNGFNSGAGGNGGNGFAIIITFCD